MARNHVLLCPCPDLRLEAAALAQRLFQAGLMVEISPFLCSPAGVDELRVRLKAEPGSWLVAACGPNRHHGLFRRLAPEERLPVVDLLEQADLESAVAAFLMAREDQGPPAAAVRPVSREVLVVGGGVGGCQAALDLADAGLKVYLLESSLSVGGVMAQLDKTFPTLDCSICILGPKLVDVAVHPNIELLTFAEITHIAGQAGSFSVAVTLNPRFVDMSRCVGCGRCAQVCPIIVPSRWNVGLMARKCIHIIFAQAVPLISTIDKDYCIDCRMCLKACEHEAINLESQPEERRLEVGAIVLATGARPFDPTIRSEYGYGRWRGVLTNLEFERLVCATGPTQGRLVTPEGRPVRRLAFIQCVGSRDRRFLPYCSGYCCTAAIKQAILAREHEPEAEIAIFFNDIRTSGKGFEELYLRAREAGIRFIKGLPGRIAAGEEGGLEIFYEDQRGGRRGRLAVDLAVLAVGLEPPRQELPFAEDGPRRDAFGFYDGRHPILHPLESTTPGVFLAGTAQGPRDISETVGTGSGVAARVLNLLKTLAS
ncbi:MAG: FAD-dependent oxidoreductase [Desulfobaccales bacterium]